MITLETISIVLYNTSYVPSAPFYMIHLYLRDTDTRVTILCCFLHTLTIFRYRGKVLEYSTLLTITLSSFFFSPHPYLRVTVAISYLPSTQVVLFFIFHRHIKWILSLIQTSCSLFSHAVETLHNRKNFLSYSTTLTINIVSPLLYIQVE